MDSATVADNLERAIASGAVIALADGRLSLPMRGKGVSPWLGEGQGFPQHCIFLSDLMFACAYGGKAVPHGCRNCYKVKLAPHTLRQLMAARELAKTIPCRSKWGTTLGHDYSTHLYAGFFYVEGLEQARDLFAGIRRAVDAHPVLGMEMPMTIKRGCTHYEMACGPSDRYTFAPELAEIEAQLFARFRPTPARRRQAMDSAATLHGWIIAAYKMGDETYRDFTGGQVLFPKTIEY